MMKMGCSDLVVSALIESLRPVGMVLQGTLALVSRAYLWATLELVDLVGWSATIDCAWAF